MPDAHGEPAEFVLVEELPADGVLSNPMPAVRQIPLPIALALEPGSTGRVSAMEIPHVEDLADHTADEAAIRAIIADTEQAFNTGDAELFVEHMAANASGVGVTGVELAGRAATLEASRVAFAGPLKGQRARYEVAGITFVRPDVALARKHAWAVDEAGELVDVGHAMTALYVLTKEQGRWWVVARQNTLVG
ncbi:conserved hypothetical protein [Pseudonocardia thermophila]|uniref:DUF4440 domain-containing protein n=1 Tax=Pseudonocardia thermophila TaxID=1848 RepID=A0A1M6ZV43_PSETH|nr:SgcJ/EcaC family oxidoreductase [Pseudonocardia thermophila]SHL34193.1 conserved hypothetical protein [Pseudonocardia thermophila]